MSAAQIEGLATACTGLTAEEFFSGSALPQRDPHGIEVAVSFETYWLVVPLIGTGCMLALWLVLRLTRTQKPKAGE